MSLNKKILYNGITFLILLIFSFFINQYYGYQGLTPLDDFLNYNCGYRILIGDIPFKDYYSVTGPVLCLTQSFFYKLFGVSWFSLVVHASVLNCIFCGIFYFFLKKIKVNIYFIFLFCISLSVLGYPNNGVPGVDHHAWILSLCSLLFFYVGLIQKNKIIFLLSPILLFIGFLVKQVPSAYFLVLISFVYFIYSIKKKNFYLFKELCFISLACIFVLIFALKIYSIEISDFIEQYFYLSLNLGSNRLEGISYDFFQEKLSNIYFLFFLILPLIINYIFFYYKLRKDFELSIINFDFFIALSLIFICYFYELHTNNAAMSFVALPIVAFFTYQIQHKVKNINSLNYVYSLIIFYSWFRLGQSNFYVAAFEFFLFLIVIIFLILKRKKLFCTQVLLFVYLVFSTIYYFQTSIDSRKYKDINRDNAYLSFNGSEIDKSFKNLNWNTSYKLNKDQEKKDFLSKINLLKKLDQNYIFITDYQIYNSILNMIDYSPVKYWHTGVSYPSKDSKYRLKFENFFRKKIIQNDIKFLIIDDKVSVFNESIKDFNFLNKCTFDVKNLINDNILVYQINNLCVKNFNNY